MNKKICVYALIALLLSNVIFSASNKKTPSYQHKNAYLTLTSLQELTNDLVGMYGNNRNAIIEGIRNALAEDYVEHMHDDAFDGKSLASHYINMLNKLPNSHRYLNILQMWLKDIAIPNTVEFTDQERERMYNDQLELMLATWGR